METARTIFQLEMGEAIDLMKRTGGITEREIQCWSRLLQSGSHNSVSCLNQSTHRIYSRWIVLTVSSTSLTLTCNISGWCYLISYHPQLEYTLLRPDTTSSCEWRHRTATPLVLNVERTGVSPFGCCQTYRVGVKEEVDCGGGWRGVGLNLLFQGFDLRCQQQS